MKCNSVIICGFPGIGKTMLYHLINKKYKDITVIDSEDLHGDRSKYPISYVDNIINNIGKYNIILSSANPKVVEELINRKIWFTILYPSLKRKNELIELYKLRADNKKMIEYMKINYERIIKYFDDIKLCNKIILENQGDFISNNENILTLIKNFKMYESR